MARLDQILGTKYVGLRWRMRNTMADLYSNLTFYEDAEGEIETTGPPEAEIRAFSDEVDALLVEEEANQLAERKFKQLSADANLKAIETLTRAVRDIYLALPANVRANVPQATIDRLIELRDRLLTIRQQ